MDIDEINKFERHLGKGKTITITNIDGTKDDFSFEPLPSTFLPDMMRMSTYLEPTKEEKARKKVMKSELNKKLISKKDYDEELLDLDDEAGRRLIAHPEGGTILVKLVENMVTLSYPELSEDMMKKFVFNNVASLMMVLIELNESLSGEENKAVENKVEALRGRVNQEKK